MRIMTFILLFFCVFAFPVSAENTYSEQFDASGAEELYDILDEDVYNIIDKLDIDIKDASWVNSLTPKSIFGEIALIFKEGIKTPLKCGAMMLALIIITAAANTFETFKPYTDAATYVFALSSSVGVLIPLFSLIRNCVSAIKAITTLMTGFIPVYVAILTVGGQAATASGMSFLLLFAAEAVGAVASFGVMPLMSCYMGIGLAGSVLPSLGTEKLGETLKKCAMWSLSLVFTVFVGLLSIQTTVNKAADSVGVKAAKFMIGSLIPVAGGALSESLTTVIGSVRLLKSSVAMFAVVGIAFTVLPVVIELLVWRVVLYMLTAVAELFDSGIKTTILKSADCVISVLVGLMLFTAALFIISLAVITGG